ncbi:BON domain-containing protein [Planctomycetaceae bacterium SH139]
MRRFFVGVALYTLAAVTPLAAWGGDREIAEQIYSKLKGQQAAGVLQGFTLDLGVNEGEVVLKGRVSNDAQRQTVLATARSVEGVTGVVDEIAVTAAETPAKPKPVTIQPMIAQGPAATGFSLSKALQEQAIPQAREVAESTIAPVSATETTAGMSDSQLKTAVVRSLSAAQRSGQLSGFGLEVTCTEGDVILRGVTQSPQVKAQIMSMVRRMSGVRNVIDDIQVRSAAVNTRRPVAAQQVRHLQPVDVQNVTGQVPRGNQGPIGPARPVSFDSGYVDGGMAQGGMMQGGMAQGGMMQGGMGGPVPMAPIPQGYGAPRYDNPNLPNYAWPGYAAHPNYAALTYPQQYSPSAWPYIGPFYPYPQVPLGWRKVSLEWDDGWWFLDFTDK